MGNGFMFLHRQLLDWEWFDNSNMVHVWIYLLLKANYQDDNWHGINVPRGSLITSLNSISKATGLSVQNVRTCLRKLKLTGEITIELTNKTTNHMSIITICKYDSYNCCESETNTRSNTQTNTQTNNKLTTDNNINKEINNNKEKDTKVSTKKSKDKSFDVREDLSYVDCFEDLWKEWLDYKDEIKKQYKTQRGAKSSFTQLKNLSNGDYYKAKAILEQSYRKSWDGFYDIKDWNSNDYPSLFSQQEQESQGNKKIEWE